MADEDYSELWAALDTIRRFRNNGHHHLIDKELMALLLDYKEVKR